MNVLASLTTDVLRRRFGSDTLDRAAAYVDQVDPSVDELTAGSLTASASIVGTHLYLVSAHVDLGGPQGEPWLYTDCSCPVGDLCKHGAALVLALRRSFVPVDEAPDEGWERELGRLIGALSESTESAGGTEPLALEVALEERPEVPARFRSTVRLPPAGLTVRPMRRGARDTWIRSNISWSQLEVSHLGRSPFVRAQAEALQSLVQALKRSQHYYALPAQAPLGSVGRPLVRLLREAHEAGVTLVPGPGLRTVEVLDDGVLDLVVDAARRDDGGTVLSVVVTDGERDWVGPRVRLLGHEAQVAAVVSDGVLRVGLLPRGVPEALRPMLAEQQAIEVPADGADSLTGALGAMSRLVDLRSRDGSVDIPEPLLPRVLLTVTWKSSTAAELTWEYQYGSGGSAHRFDLLAGRFADPHPVRDRRAEGELFDVLPPHLLVRRPVEDGDALALAVHDLPHLRSLEGVDVHEEQRPDFRETEVAPEIRFDVVEPDPDDDSGDAPTDWLDLRVVVDVDGERVPLPDVLAALTRDDEFLVLPSGLFLRTDHPALDRLREVVAAAAELRERDGDRLRVGTHDLGVWAQLAEAGVVDEQAGAWVRRAQALRDLVEIPRPEPTGVVTELRSYQREGFWWLAFLHQHGLGGILADDMGLGKTLQVLALVAHARSDRPFLVVAPTSVVTAWASEAARHTPGLRLATISRRSDDVAAAAAHADVVVTTYALLRLEQHAYADQEWAGLVLDEAQQVKNHQSKTYAAVRLVEAPFRLAVTGTPFENRLMELWSLLSITTPGLYPWPRSFTDHVVKPVEKRGDAEALRRFQRRIKPFVLRRTKEIVADDLPPKQEQVLEVALGTRHRRLYDARLAKARQRILGLVDDFDRNRVAIFSALTELRMLALDPALVDAADDAVGSAKIDVLVEHLAEITAEGHQALVFSQFTSFLRRVRDRLDAARIPTTYLDGGTTDRGAVIDRFRSGEAPVFLISLKAGGVGLTLTEADYVFVLDPWWNPAAEAQAVDRAHRIGQRRHVHVYRLVATDTIEDKVMELKERKAALFARVVDGEGGLGTGIDADDIRGLFDA